MKNYEALSDEQLIELLRKGESGPEEYLVKKYKGMVLKKAHAMFLIGGEQEDLACWGFLKRCRGISPERMRLSLRLPICAWSVRWARPLRFPEDRSTGL